MIGSAFKRSLRLDEVASPRVSDLPAVVASTNGKVEMESAEEGREFKVVDSLVKKAVQNTFGRYFSLREFDAVLMRFDEGLAVETGADVPSERLHQEAPADGKPGRSGQPYRVVQRPGGDSVGDRVCARRTAPQPSPEPRSDRGPHHIFGLARIHRFIQVDGVRTAEGCEGVTGAIIRA